MRFIDAHCHLSSHTDFLSVFMRANSDGITGCVLNSTQESDWPQIATLATSGNNICGALGIHPWFSGDVTSNWESDLIALLRGNPNLMIGEIGLDKTRDNFDAQEKIFIRQLELAIQYKRIINLHCVHAWDKMLKILQSYKPDLPKIVAHSFDGTENAINFDTDLYFSYSPNIAVPRYKKARASVFNIPKNKILVESDCDNLSKTILALNGILSLRDDISADDIYNNAMGVFFNGQITQNTFITR